MDLSKILIFTIIIFLITGFAISYESDRDTDTDSSDDTRSTDDDDTTECEENPDSEACEDPDYADDQAEYIYDLDASWAFSGGSAPTNSGPSIFYGQQAGGEFEDGTVTFEQDKEGSIEEQYIENTGSADTDMWGRGTLTSTTIDITGSKVISGTAGEQLVTSPYSGQCGDGIPNTGDEVSCPEDWGTPEIVTLTDEPTPVRDLWFEEPHGNYEYEAPEEDQVWYIEGDGGNSPDYYEVNNAYIEEEVLVGPDQVIILSGQHQTYSSGHWSGGGLFDEEPDGSSFDYYTGSDATDDQEVCEDYGEVDNVYSDVDTETTEASTELGTQEYDAPIMSTNSLEVTVEYDYIENTEPLYAETDCNDLYTSCDCDEDEEEEEGSECDCTQQETTSYNGGDVTTYATSTYDWRVEIDEYDLDQNTYWGHVDHTPEMFENYYGLSVYDSNFGYHSIVSDDGRQGSNNPSVSANSYSLREGSDNFYAERVESNVANADGPDGRGNGYIAYSESNGIEGASNGLFESEYWNSGSSNYIDESDIPPISCPEADRCVVSLDVSTDQSGWGSNPSSSFTIEY